MPGFACASSCSERYAGLAAPSAAGCAAASIKRSGHEDLASYQDRREDTTYGRKSRTELFEQFMAGKTCVDANVDRILHRSASKEPLTNFISNVLPWFAPEQQKAIVAHFLEILTPKLPNMVERFIYTEKNTVVLCEGQELPTPPENTVKIQLFLEILGKLPLLPPEGRSSPFIDPKARMITGDDTAA